MQLEPTRTTLSPRYSSRNCANNISSPTRYFSLIPHHCCKRDSAATGSDSRMKPTGIEMPSNASSASPRAAPPDFRIASGTSSQKSSTHGSRPPPAVTMRLFRHHLPTEQRVEAAVLYHAGLSFPRVDRVVGRSCEGVRQLNHRLAHLFEPTPVYHRTVAVEETKVRVEDDEVYLWTTVNADTFGVDRITRASTLDAVIRQSKGTSPSFASVRSHAP